MSVNFIQIHRVNNKEGIQVYKTIISQVANSHISYYTKENQSIYVF